MTSVTAVAIREEIHDKVRKLDELDPPPERAQRLINAVGDDNVEVNDLAVLIDGYPPVAARVVGLARSAYFKRATPVRTVHEAIVRVLGLHLVKNIVMGIALSGSFAPQRCPRFDGGLYWRSALLTATLARQLARAAARGAARANPEDAYLCGLLHNLGLLALIHVAPAEMDDVFGLAANAAGRGLREIEQELAGIDHAHAGACLARRWHLPDEVTAVMEHAHDAGYRGAHWPLTLLVGVSASWVQQQLAAGKEGPRELQSLDEVGIDDATREGALESFVGQIEEIESLARVFSEPD